MVVDSAVEATFIPLDGGTKLRSDRRPATFAEFRWAGSAVGSPGDLPSLEHRFVVLLGSDVAYFLTLTAIERWHPCR